MGFGAHLPLRNSLASLHGEPVACSTLVLAAGVAGIYCVATVPEARRQGSGGAITAAPLHIARAMGYRIGILQASESGHPVYRRLGFQEFCTLGLYLWQGADV
ncbi:MAG TPA: GNAT family N-acetyltransferase [Chthonomonadaceae bacterium]|nr:GNAT family N-acetyltransferase [Chthonomonadaceae bacterium]